METCRILNPKQAGLYIKHITKDIKFIDNSTFEI